MLDSLVSLLEDYLKTLDSGTVPLSIKQNLYLYIHVCVPTSETI